MRDRPNPQDQLAGTPSQRIGLVSWIAWVVATPVGFAAFPFADWALGGKIARVVNSAFGSSLGLFVGFIVVGAAVGTLQALVLRRHICSLPQ